VNAAHKPQPGFWTKIVALGAALGVIAGIVSHIDSIEKTLSGWFPGFLGPFDADISIRDVRVTKSVLMQQSFDGSPAESAVDSKIEYLEVKSGNSPLKDCHTQVLMGSDYDQDKDFRKPETVFGITKALQTDRFVFRKKDYAKQGKIRMICDRGYAEPVTFDLPSLPGTGVNSHYLVCIGEYPNACGSNVVWQPCGSDVTVWAKREHTKECASIDYKKLSDVSGNHCGYATFDVSCTSQ
jgi:hypothetical protein